MWLLQCYSCIIFSHAIYFGIDLPYEGQVYSSFFSPNKKLLSLANLKSWLFFLKCENVLELHMFMSVNIHFISYTVRYDFMIKIKIVVENTKFFLPLFVFNVVGEHSHTDTYTSTCPLAQSSEFLKKGLSSIC